MFFNIALYVTNLSNVLNFSNKLIYSFSKSFDRGTSQLNLFVHII